ncbi:MAG TPA: glutamate racemase [Saprospiraceae bacterium]|nr:glutamate racemase [Saprospiraceae bacterium]
MKAPIGIFDSGYGGLTVFKEIKKQLPQYDYIYLGDNARAPYGTRSFDTVYKYTLQCVKWFFDQNCPLVILACNTASAKALRTIQQNDLSHITESDNRVLGVIRPTSETIGKLTNSKHIGLLATSGTVNSDSYPIEIQKYWPDSKVFQQACPMWVPLIENNEFESEGALYFFKKDLESLFNQSKDIDTILLGCTHYPVLMNILEKLVPPTVKITSQDEIVAESLKDYLNRHTNLERKISKDATTEFYTTGTEQDFDTHAPLFFGQQVCSHHVDLG